MATLEQVIKDAQMLQPHELQRLRQALDELLAEAETPQVSEDEFERQMVAEGLLAPIEPNEPDDEEEDDWTPVTVTGQPLSEMIIEERR